MRSKLPILTVLVLLGCELLTFSVDQEATTTIQGAGVVGTLLGALDFSELDDFDVEIEQEIQDQGVEPGDLESVELTRLSLSASPDLSFIERMDVYVSAADVEEVLVASVDNFPEGQTTVDLEMTGANLADHVVAGEMVFRVDATGDAPADDTEVTVNVAVEVTATAQGACGAIGG